MDPKVITTDPQAGAVWLSTHYPERPKMDPKYRDHIAIAVGSAAVLYALQQKRSAKIQILVAVGGATALWMISRWENAEQ